MRSPPAGGTLLAMTAASHRNQKRLLEPAEAEVHLDGVVAAHNSHDPAALVAHFTPDGVVRADEFMNHPATHRGVELLGCSRFTFTQGD